jgi:peptidoglycan/LPS O-acetylase OafA/YrhL
MSATTIDSGGSAVDDPTGASEGTARAGRDGSRTDQGSVLRTDIQGLRAVAVSLVVIYHLLPSSLAGGFTGVDVFFVISGFLITLHLMQKPPEGGRDLAKFWGRRIRRLLPASLLVLASTLVVSRIVAPDTQWGNTASQARAATLYVVNWLLARDSVDYLAAENAPSPVQHFWSLSVEEQFYFVWPILILGMVLLARRYRWNRDLAVLGGLGVLVTVSLGYSIWETARNPAAAYFVTPTRMWELGIGGLLAVVVAVRQRRGLPHLLPETPRVVLAWVGFAAIAWTAVTYTGRTPFPGWQALLPVVGTALVIGAHSPMTRLSPGPLLAVRPVQWLGDVSYSVYLWHWPLIVLIPQIRGHEMDNLDRTVALVLTLVLAWLTKEYVEDRFRTPQWGIPLRKPFLLGAAGMVVVIALAGLQQLEVDRREAQAEGQLARALAEGGPCFGAAALDDPGNCESVPYDRIVPAPVDALADRSRAYKDVSGGKDCFSYLPVFRSVRCTFGDKNSDTEVALVGNSHAGQWLPTLERLAEKNGWRVTTYLASQCAAAETAQAFDTRARTDACLAWVDRTTRAVARSKPAAVVYTNRISVGAAGQSFEDSGQLYSDGMESVLRTWDADGLNVLVLRDTPAPSTSVPDCLAQHPDDVSACDGTRAEWLPEDHSESAVRRVDSSRITFLDLTDHICQAERCSAVTGGVVTYFDGSHLTATFASTLDRYLGPPLRRLVAAGR